MDEEEKSGRAGKSDPISFCTESQYDAKITPDDYSALFQTRAGLDSMIKKMMKRRISTAYGERTGEQAGHQCMR